MTVTSVRTGRDLFLLANTVDELGGVTAWTHQMARLFQAAGHRVHVIGVHEAELKLTLPADLGYDVTSLYPAHPPTPRPIRGLARLNPVAHHRETLRLAGRARAVARLTEIFRTARPGAVAVVTQVWPMEWVREADTSGLRIIGMSHESYAYTKACHRYRSVRRNYPSVDRWLALTQEDADDWIADGMHNVGAMPNALAHLPEVPSPRTAKVVCSIGRLADQKGIDMLVDTWARVAPHRPGWTLRIYGAGADEPDLRAQCTRLGLNASVRWMGPTDDVPGALAGSAVFVQSSRGEGFPLALMEAMASAVPCAAFDCAPGVREIVRDGEDGLLAPPGDISALADRLLRLTGNPRMRDAIGERARVNVQRFSEERVLERWEELFALLER
ncbi:glycosyltransferase family 4 protein [Streptomyces antnestii]|uniref:D-inositol 3-phosphate glycosyltransferase n=1 Tax=Streptomyces antnestii TaxID=2494256 RepID=A0A3S2XVC9_9ACTN|nr:glycosyltransferase [Streptomyces sp. San01]RVU24520.1 glycosyltransferase family 4 protein [Streptomyces sp. San01]